MKKFRYFILVLAGVAAMMLGGCKDKEKYDESAFQDDLEPLTPSLTTTTSIRIWPTTSTSA